MVLIYVFLMADDVKHLFMFFTAICMSSLEKCLFKFFTHLKFGGEGLFIIELYTLDTTYILFFIYSR